MKLDLLANEDADLIIRKIDDSLELRLLTEKDAEALFALTDANRAYLRAWLPWVDGTRTVADTSDYLNGTVLAYIGGTAVTTGIRYRGTLVGSIGCQSIDRNAGSTEIGYWLDQSLQGQGLMTRTCRAMVDYAVTDLGMRMVEIHCAVENSRSRAIPERLGFTQVEVRPQVEWLYDHFVDHVIYRMPAQTWKQTSA